MTKNLDQSGEGSRVEDAPTIRVQQKLKISGLKVQKALLGREHRFRIEGQDAFLRLPEFVGADGGGSESPAYYPVEWQGDSPGEEQATWYAVHECEIGFRCEWLCSEEGGLDL
jgi:hypothetical protein